MDATAIKTAWITPSHDFNRLAYRIVKNEVEVLEFRVYADRKDKWTRFRVPAIELGPHFLSVIDSLEEKIPPVCLTHHSGLVLGVRKS